MVGPRRLLGRHDALFFRERVYELEDCLEVDEFTLTTIERRRVPFDEVLAASSHRRRGPAFLALTGLFALASGIAAVALVVAGEGTAVAGAVILGPVTAGFLFAFILRLSLGVDVITVHGRRTMARLAFGYRKAQAREVFERLTRRIREHQDKLAAELPPPAEPDAPAPPGPAGL